MPRTADPRRRRRAHRSRARSGRSSRRQRSARTCRRTCRRCRTRRRRRRGGRARDARQAAHVHLAGIGRGRGEVGVAAGRDHERAHDDATGGEVGERAPAARPFPTRAATGARSHRPPGVGSPGDSHGAAAYRGHTRGRCRPLPRPPDPGSCSTATRATTTRSRSWSPPATPICSASPPSPATHRSSHHTQRDHHPRPAGHRRARCTPAPSRPLVAEPKHADYVHGESGMDGADLPEPSRPAGEHRRRRASSSTRAVPRRACGSSRPAR